MSTPSSRACGLTNKYPNGLAAFCNDIKNEFGNDFDFDRDACFDLEDDDYWQILTGLDPRLSANTNQSTANRRDALNRYLGDKYDSIPAYQEDEEGNAVFSTSDLSLYWENPPDYNSVCELNRTDGETSPPNDEDRVYYSAELDTGSGLRCEMLSEAQTTLAWNNASNGRNADCHDNREDIRAFNESTSEGEGCLVDFGNDTEVKVYREYFPQIPLACTAYNNDDLAQSELDQVLEKYSQLRGTQGEDGSFETKEACEAGDSSPGPDDDVVDEEPDPPEDNTEVPVNINNEISYLDGNVCRYIPVTSSDWVPIVQSIPDPLNPDRNFLHEGEQYYLEGEAKSLFYCCLDNQNSNYELETQLQLNNGSDVGIWLRGNCSDMVDISSEDIVSNFSGTEPLCPIIGGSEHNQEDETEVYPIDSIPLYTLSQSQIEAFSLETRRSLLPITVYIIAEYFPPDNEDLRLVKERILIEEEGALPNVEPSLATLVLDGSVQYEGHDFFYLEDREQCFDSSGSSSYFEDDLIENAYAQVESEIEVESISRSGRYRFFLDGDKIAERDISIDGENFEAKYFQDINNNQVKDPSEPFLDGFDENITIRLLEDIDVVGYDLDSGWNLIHLPLVNDDEDRIARASDLLSYWEGQNTTIYHIAIYENGRFNMFTSREGDINYDQDFELSPGQGMFVFNNGDRRQVTFPGRKLSEPLPLNLTSGWNLIGLASPSANYNSESLLNTINDDGINANILSRFDSGIYQSVVREDELIFGNNYNVIETEGYFLRVESNPGQFTP
jgi:hypothetical protein